MANEDIVVNGFMFCQAHGYELCHICTCDHRMTNNIQIEDDLGDLSHFLVFDVEERLPRNAYALGVVAAVDTEDSYQCQKHKNVDCDKCFNWVDIIIKEAEDKEEQGGLFLESRVLSYF